VPHAYPPEPPPRQGAAGCGLFAQHPHHRRTAPDLYAAATASATNALPCASGRSPVLLHGGSGSCLELLSDVWLFDKEQMRWGIVTQEGACPGPLTGHTMLAVDDSTAITFGGRGFGATYSNSLYQLVLTRPTPLLPTEPTATAFNFAQASTQAVCKNPSVHWTRLVTTGFFFSKLNVQKMSCQIFDCISLFINLFIYLLHLN
jgi:hypothetical protein